MFDLGALIGSLNEHGVNFVVIGGVAVGAHGYLRATEDLDIVSEPSAENHDRLATLLSELEATLPTAQGRRFDPETDIAALRRGRNLTVQTSLGDLDLIQLAAGVPPYSGLIASAERAELLGVPVNVCSLDHLRAMKASAGRAQDEADLENLPEA